MLKINLKKLVKHMGYFQTNQKKKIMITLAMLHLKMVVVEKVVLGVSVVLAVLIFLIYLKTSLVILVEEVDEVQEKVPTIEVQTSDMIYQYL